MIEEYIKYFYAAKGVAFDKEREKKFREFIQYAFNHNKDTERYMDWYYDRVLENPDAFVNEGVFIKDFCKQFPIFNKKWIQNKRMEKYKNEM